LTVRDLTESVWLNQPGRLSARTGSCADGFRGTGVMAGAVAVAEGPHGMMDLVMKAVSTVRDTFAEGVAYGADTLLADIMDELLEELPEEISVAAAAFLGRGTWVYTRGGCRAFVAGLRSEEATGEVTPVGEDSLEEVELSHGQCLLLVSRGLVGLAGSPQALAGLSKCRRPLEQCLVGIVAGTRIRFDRIGGSAAAVRYCRRARRIPEFRYYRAVLALAAAAAAGLLTLPLCGRGDGPAGGDPEETSDTSETVMPLD